MYFLCRYSRIRKYIEGGYGSRGGGLERGCQRQYKRKKGKAATEIGRAPERDARDNTEGGKENSAMEVDRARTERRKRRERRIGEEDRTKAEEGEGGADLLNLRTPTSGFGNNEFSSIA